MDKTYVKGQKLFITTEEATYDGTFHSMDEGKTRLTVKDVVKHPSEESFDGLFHFYRSEIISVQIMDPLASPWLAPGTELVSSKISSIMRGCQTSTTFKFIAKQFNNNELPREKYNYYLNLLKKFMIIDDVDAEFEEAMEDIKKQSIIGVSFEGAQLGRKGNLSWICVCCRYSDETDCQIDQKHQFKFPQHVTVYLFDLAMMGNVAISKGLGEILQGKSSPTKIIHDCRLPSDCLFHQFDVTLENVLDTQIAEAIISHPKYREPEGEGGQPLMFTRSLHQCLSRNLGLPSSLLYHPNINDGYLQRSLDIWYQRPITSLMAKAAVYQTIYLINLWYKVRYVEFTDAFKRSVKFYLSSIRDADDNTAYMMTHQYHLMPDKLVDLVMRTHEKFEWRKKNRSVANS